MFTGIITDVGTVCDISKLASGKQFAIQSSYDADTIDVGASIACSGPCLTVVSVVKEPSGALFNVDVSTETLARTNLGDWEIGTPVNLERSLRAGDELGGHIVSGHVDGTAKITARTEDGDMARFDLSIPGSLARYVAEKGSVALDGVSLTINSVGPENLSVLVIPHSLTVTNWGAKRAGDKVNLEVDQFARYLDRLAMFEKT